MITFNDDMLEGLCLSKTFVAPQEHSSLSGLSANANFIILPLLCDVMLCWKACYFWFYHPSCWEFMFFSFIFLLSLCYFIYSLIQNRFSLSLYVIDRLSRTDQKRMFCKMQYSDNDSNIVLKDSCQKLTD